MFDEKRFLNDPPRQAGTRRLKDLVPGNVRYGCPPSTSHVPVVPLTDAQYEDYLALVGKAQELHAAGRFQEAGRIKQVASNILRTGAPALE